MTIVLQLRAFDRALLWFAVPVAGAWTLAWLADDLVAATDYALTASLGWSGLVAGFAVGRIHDWHGSILAPRFPGSLFAAGAILIGTVGAMGLALCWFAGNHTPLVGPALVIACGAFFGLVDRSRWSAHLVLGPSVVDRMSPWAFAALGVIALLRHLDGTFSHHWPQLVEVGAAGVVLAFVRRGLNDPAWPPQDARPVFVKGTRYAVQWHEEVWTEAQAGVVVLGIIVAVWLATPTAWQTAFALGVLGGLWALFAAASLADSLRSLHLRLRWNWLLANQRSRGDSGRRVSVRLVLRLLTSLPVGAVGVVVHASQDSVLEGRTLFEELLVVYIGLLAAALACMRFHGVDRSVRRHLVLWVASVGIAGACLAAFAPLSYEVIGNGILVVVLSSLAVSAVVLGGRGLGRVEVAE